MYPAIKSKCQLPLSLFHPRWLLDGLATVDSWQMSWTDNSSKLNEKYSDSSHKTESKEDYNNGPETEDEEQFVLV